MLVFRRQSRSTAYVRKRKRKEVQVYLTIKPDGFDSEIRRKRRGRPANQMSPT